MIKFKYFRFLACIDAMGFTDEKKKNDVVAKYATTELKWQMVVMMEKTQKVTNFKKKLILLYRDHPIL